MEPPIRWFDCVVFALVFGAPAWMFFVTGWLVERRHRSAKRATGGE